VLKEDIKRNIDQFGAGTDSLGTGPVSNSPDAELMTRATAERMSLSQTQRTQT